MNSFSYKFFKFGLLLSLALQFAASDAVAAGHTPLVGNLKGKARTQGNVSIPEKWGYVDGTLVRATNRGEYKETPLKNVEIVVYAGKMKQAKFPNDDVFLYPFGVETKGKKPVASEQTNEKGEFELVLDPGEYTVFAKIGDKLLNVDGPYANIREGKDSYWSTVTIKKGKRQKQKIVDDQTVH